MKRIIFFIGFCYLLVGLQSCTKNEVMDFTGEDSVYFYERYMYLGYDERRTETLVYSFAVQPSDMLEDIVPIKVQLQGRVSSQDRVVRATYIVDSTSAKENKHFTIQEGLIKAGEYEGVLPVMIYRSEDLKDNTVRVKLQIIDSDALLAGVVEDSFIALEISDKLVRPTNWPEWYGFGAYSDNKYRFVLDILGIADFPVANRYQTEPIDGIYTAAQLFAFAHQLQEEYIEYRKEYGPIYMDDNADPKVEINFN